MTWTKDLRKNWRGVTLKSCSTRPHVPRPAFSRKIAGASDPVMSKKKENELRKAALEGDLDVLGTLIASGVGIDGPAPKVCPLISRAQGGRRVSHDD